jgi:siroheme synthase-like protein
MAADIENKIPYLPLFFNLVGAPCLVVGGGRVALRKVKDLLAAGAAVTIVSPSSVDELVSLSQQGECRWLQRAYIAGEVQNYRLVISAANSLKINKQVSQDCATHGIPVNVVDQPALCNVIFPAVVSLGGATIAVSTGGTAPYFARFLKEHLKASLAEVHQLQYPDLIARFRKFAKNYSRDSRHETDLYQRFLSADAAQWASWAKLKSPEASWRHWLKNYLDSHE